MVLVVVVVVEEARHRPRPGELAVAAAKELEGPELLPFAPDLRRRAPRPPTPQYSPRILLCLSELIHKMSNLHSYI